MDLNSRGVFAALGLLVGLGADQAMDLTFGVWDRWSEHQSDNLERHHSNIDRILQIWNKPGNLEEKTFFTLVLVESGMVKPGLACSLVSYALNSGTKGNVLRSLSMAFTADLRKNTLNRDSCDLDKYINSEGMKIPVSPGGQDSGDPKCPVGTLYTQFGSDQQLSFGRLLIRNYEDSGFQITQPEIIDGFNSDRVQIRYFDPKETDIAKNWTKYVKLLAPSTVDEKIELRYIPGYEKKMAGRKRFELWWPEEIPTPNAPETALCF